MLVTSVDDGINQPQRIRTLDFPPQLSLENGMVDWWKVLLDIALLAVLVSSRPGCELCECSVRAIAYPIRIGLLNHRGLQQRHDHIAQCGMYHPISVRRSRNNPRLRIFDCEGALPSCL